MKRIAGRQVPATVRSHEGSGGEEVDVLDAPAAHDGTESGIVEGHESLPELGVLTSKARRHVDVQAVVDEHEFRLAGRRGGWLAADEDVAWMRVAVDVTPEEHLCREEIHHGGHDTLEGDTESSFPIGSAPVVPLRFHPSGLVVFVVVAVAVVERRTATSRTPFQPTPLPRTRDGFLIPQTHAFDPFDGQYAFRTEFPIYPWNVDAISEGRLAGHKTGHAFGIVRLVFKVGLEKEPFADVGDETGEGDVKEPTIRPGNYSKASNSLVEQIHQMPGKRKDKDILERPQIPPNLLLNLTLLNLDSNLPSIRQSCPMHLSNTSTSPSLRLHHPMTTT